MKFVIIKNLINGRYFVKAEITERTEEDQIKASKFGYPNITIKLPNGKELPVKVNLLNRIDAYGFYDREEADEYSENLKVQIISLKKRWNSLEDNWSKQEEL